MQLGMVGLGRMGANLVKRAMAGGHEAVGHDIDRDVTTSLSDAGATPAYSLAEMVEALESPRTVWVMLPAAFVDGTLDELVGLLEPGDVVIDGGNSYYRDDMARAARLSESQLHYLDIGTSGGVYGLERGYCLMIGGEDEVVARHASLFDTLAPGVDAAERTPGRSGSPTPEERGWLHCGPNGAGHFVKMVHNGIEYGVMAAYAEGLAILKDADIGSRPRQDNAESAPLAEPEFYQFDLDTTAIAEVWRRGSVIGSWLLDLTALALHEDPELETFRGRVSDSGEGRWTIQAAVDEGVPAPVLSSALFSRFASRDNAEFANRTLSAMRKQFGGHDENPANLTGGEH